MLYQLSYASPNSSQPSDLGANPRQNQRAINRTVAHAETGSNRALPQSPRQPHFIRGAAFLPVRALSAGEDFCIRIWPPLEAYGLPPIRKKTARKIPAAFAPEERFPATKRRPRPLQQLYPPP